MAVLPLSAVPSGSCLFLDANIFIYALTGTSSECLALLRRCASEEVYGFTASHIICEATHRFMMQEALSVGLPSRPSDLKRIPNEVAKLHRYWSQTESILKMNLAILEPEETWLRSAHTVRVTYGLLTNDSLAVAAMREYGIDSIASRDSDFGSLSGVMCYSPTDCP